MSEMYIGLQIRELHRVYHKQRELMDEFKRSELHKQNVRLEPSWSSSALLSKNAEKTFYSPNRPWSTSQSSVLFAESIQLPLAFAQEKSKQIFPAHASTVTEEPLKDYKLPESMCRKVGKKVLDLELPADEYIDSDEGEENVRVTEVLQDSAYSLNGVSQVLCDNHDKPRGNSSRGSDNLNVSFKLDLNVPLRLEVEAATKSSDKEVPSLHMNNCLYDLSMKTIFGSQNLHNDAINKRQDLEGGSHNQRPDNEKKCEWKFSGNGFKVIMILFLFSDLSKYCMFRQFKLWLYNLSFAFQDTMVVCWILLLKVFIRKSNIFQLIH